VGGSKHKIKSRDGASRTNGGDQFLYFFYRVGPIYNFFFFFFLFFFFQSWGDQGSPWSPLPPFLIKRKQNGHSQALK
jgi:hypothetical protein